MLFEELFTTKEEKKAFYRARAEALYNPEDRIKSKEDLKNYNLPEEIIKIMSGWEVIVKSPYGESFYNSKDIDWTHKPDGSFRVSDHWNFKSAGDDFIHCKTDKPVKNNEYVSLAQYDRSKGVYKILLTLPSPEFVRTLLNREEREKYLKSPEVIQMKKDFKARVKNKEVFAKVKKRGKEYDGVVVKYTGPLISMDDRNGNAYFQDELEHNDPIYLYDKEGNEIRNPFKKFFNGQFQDITTD